MRIIGSPRRSRPERLLWSRDIRFVHRLVARAPGARVLELESGMVLVAPAYLLTEGLVDEVAKASVTTSEPEYGLVTVDASLQERDRYVIAMSAAVQVSGLADRIGMAPSTQVVQTKMLDYFFSLRKLHGIAFQPIVSLEGGRLHEYECLFRPEMPMLPQSIGSVVQAALDTDRAVELDSYIVATVLERIGRIEAATRAAGEPARRFAINLSPVGLAARKFDAASLGDRVRAAGLEPHQITIECTEQQAVADLAGLQHQVKALRRAGFGVAVDDAGAGHASFALIAALRPSTIKIDRDIVRGIGRDEAKQALVEAFVSFGRRIGAHIVAEGIERRVDLTTLQKLGVEFGQGFLLGKPELEPGEPRRFERRGPAAPDDDGAPARPARVPSGA
jgi:EAL domain-containing protein (putative c-di-GMP-specific phosphodiesterase class I)